MTNRSETSTSSVVRRDGDRRALRETQWVEATSVGWGWSVGKAGRVDKKMKGLRTINLEIERACVSVKGAMRIRDR